MEKELSDEKNRKQIIIISAILLLLLLIIIFLLLFMNKKYDVTFDSNGGSEVAAVVVKKNKKIEEPEPPTKDGYTFAGWYYNDELYDFNTPVKHNMVLKAEWAVLGNAEIEGVALNATEVTLAPGGSAVLVATLLPENAKATKLIWTSSDESIAVVDENGNVKAIKEGTVTITVTTEDGNFVATCTITVTNQIVQVEGVSISGPQEVTIGNSINLTAVVTPDNATNKGVTWSSSNKNVAKVDQNGKVTGLKAGKVTITATTVDGGHEATYTVTIKASENNNDNGNNSSQVTPNNPTPTPPTPPTPSGSSTVYVTSVSINGSSSREMYVGDVIQLTANINPTNATNKNVVWSSSNNGIARVDANGNVTGISEGTVTITVTTVDGNKSASVTVTVRYKSTDPTGIKISGPTTVKVDGTITLTATVEPSYANNKTVTWSSGNDAVATVDASGNVTGVCDGTVIITATTSNGKSATYTVTVKSDYVITLTAMKKETTTFKYAVKITRDGKNFNDFKVVNYGTHPYRFTGSAPTVSSDDIDVSIKTAEIVLKNGTIVTAQVIYID